MINKLLIGSLLLSSIIHYTNYSPVYTKSAVILAGSIISSQHIPDNKKHKRKDCPVCKGKGWYISGDGIKKVDCGYCEPEPKSETNKVVIHPPVIVKESCPDGICKPQSVKGK